jgi:lipopolysaccharide assembly LptE-like protein
VQRVQVVQKVLFIVILAAAVGSSNCGYALAGRGSFLPTDIRIVGIPPLVNRTTFFDVEQILTEKIRNEFIGRGKYRVVPEASGSDAVLNAEITSITLSPVAFTNTQLASRYQFVLTMKVDFTDNRVNKSLWANDALSFTGEYDLTSGTGDPTINAATFVDQQRSSFDRIANDVARTVVTAIVEAF